MRILFPLLLLAACGPGKDDDDADTSGDTADTDTTDTDTADTADTDTADTDTADTDATDTDTADEDTADTDEPAGPPDGAALFAGTCALCHGADGTGTGEYPDITGELDRTDEELLDIILNGKDEMPPQPLSEEQAQAVIDWMRESF